jgi:SpoVK/Ycf46/Vps4 family AAA+-type ATPase
MELPLAKENSDGCVTITDLEDRHHHLDTAAEEAVTEVETDMTVAEGVDQGHRMAVGADIEALLRLGTLMTTFSCRDERLEMCRMCRC